MSKPSKVFTWATDAAYVDTGEAWDGVAPTLEPSAGLKAEGFEPATRISARFLNWLLNVIGAWITYWNARIDSSEEIVYEVAKTRALNISPIGTIMSGQSKIVGGAAAGVLTQGQSLNDGWRVFEAALFGGGPGGTDTYGLGDYVKTSLPQHVGYINVSNYLRTGQTILSVLAAVDPGTAQATASDRMKFSLIKRNLAAYAAGSVIASANADATANQQTFQVTGLSEVVDRETYAYWIAVWSSAGAAGTADALYGLTIGVTDPGLRNN